MTFGRYKVTDREPVIKMRKWGKYWRERWYWECACLGCGNVMEVIEGHLKKSANGCQDCSRKNVLGPKLGKWVREKRKVYADSGIGSLYRVYQRNMAEKRGLAFKLSYQAFSNIVSRDCYYCGAKPRPYNIGSYSDVKANGVDRVNNNLGYVESNCVPCCTECNREKNDLTRERVYKFFPDLNPGFASSEALLYM